MALNCHFFDGEPLYIYYFFSFSIERKAATSGLAQNTMRLSQLLDQKKDGDYILLLSILRFFFKIGEAILKTRKRKAEKQKNYPLSSIYEKVYDLN